MKLKIDYQTEFGSRTTIINIDELVNFTRKFKLTSIEADDLYMQERCCDFALWLQDNYSTNKKQGKPEPLPKGYWRKDFTNEHYSITELIAIYNRSCN